MQGLRGRFSSLRSRSASFFPHLRNIDGPAWHWVALWDESIDVYYQAAGLPMVKDKWIIRRRRVLPPVPYWPPIWKMPTEAVPWHVPAVIIKPLQPWWYTRVYCHMMERVLFDLWWWSRAPMWWANDVGTSIDWKIQGWLKARVEERRERTRRNELRRLADDAVRNVETAE